MVIILKFFEIFKTYARTISIYCEFKNMKKAFEGIFYDKNLVWNTWIGYSIEESIRYVYV